MSEIAETKSPYWFGICVYKATNSLLSSKSNQYPSHYGSGRTARYKQDIANKQVVADCIGDCKGYTWSNGGQGVLEAISTDKTYARKFGSNGCPDKSASGMFSYAKNKGMDWGTIVTLPEIPGLALFKKGHAGYYVGNGYAVEWKGFNYGCVKTDVKGRGWLNWYKLPFIDYGDADTKIPAPEVVETITLGSRLLKKGITGTDVKTLQDLLNQVGASLTMDGIFGSKTEAAVKAFQKKAGIKQDGKYGCQSHAALMATIAEKDAPLQNDPTPAESVQNEPVTAEKKTVIVCDNDTVNLRIGNDTKYTRITCAEGRTVLPYVATVDNGWHAVIVGDKVGWVSGKYSKIE